MVNPYSLLIVPDGGYPQQIDLDLPGWATKYALLMRVPGAWYLVEQGTDAIKLSIHVLAGEQPYYTLRHFGSNKSEGHEVLAWGIGKKGLDGTMTRLWILENGQVCGGDDVDRFGPLLL